ncbi:MAG: hypothetical protein M5R40_20490 [Anaerolineae bacterium]|nr:hypothetical protein [Anaerolineae bacterium]
MNAAWAGWLLGALAPLARADFWTDPAAAQQVERLLKHLGDAP